MTYREALVLGEKVLKTANIEDAKNDAWLLLAMACKIDHTYYFVHMDEEMQADQVKEYEGILRKRGEHVPLQYITGEQEFMGMTFHVKSNVLIPRQDTETLVEEALHRVTSGMKVLDMCTGSGCVLISILEKCKGTTGVGVDVSKQALIVAKENARMYNVPAEFERSDLFENIAEKFDMIVSNPPYIRSDEIPTLMPEVCEFEPLLALDGKEDGLFFYRRIVAESKEHLTDGGWLLFEIGCDQGQEVSDMMRYAGFSNVSVIKDLARNDRVVCGQL
ncbi:MAG: peptide chain release factor N(5)-glutamine methyltransferase [Lachnospiraceae bacterium]|nr:peptide chain release factor N(5)-glutamine methyltransferase [Lachnospiraceae bacterium]